MAKKKNSNIEENGVFGSEDTSIDVEALSVDTEENSASGETVEDSPAEEPKPDDHGTGIPSSGGCYVLVDGKTIRI